MVCRHPYKADVIGTQAAPVAKAAGQTAFSTVVQTNGSEWLTGTVSCTKAHTVKVWGGNTAAAPADATTMHLLTTITGKQATSGSYGDAFSCAVDGFAWVAIAVTNNDVGDAADVWATVAVTP